MTDFVVKRDRDAWGPIRGYVYQVDLTIERWLQLQPSQVLELERGEDIDTVNKAITTQGDEQSRILEQIKARENNITLRSPQALEALASFHEHLAANPADIDLSFRYVTNAEIATERPSPMPNKTPLISVWEQIRLGTITAQEQPGAIKVIKDFISTAIKPDGLRDETWTEFKDFIKNANDVDILPFVRKVEWMTRQTPMQEMALHIQQILITKHSVSLEQAEELYPRLFLHVFKLLSDPGVKRLTPEDRDVQLAMPTLSAMDQLLLENLKITLTKLSERVEVLEEAVSLLQEQNSVILDQQVKLLAQRHGVDAKVDYSLHAPILDVPPLVSPIVRREEVVRSLIAKFRANAWCHIHGDVGRGKRQLAILIAESLNCRAWVRLRDLSIDQSCYQIDQALIALSKIQPSRWQSWCNAVCASLEEGTLLVIEDVPRVPGSDVLSERLILLGRSCAGNGIKLLSTSAQDLPPQIKQSLSKGDLFIEAIPEFTDQEVAQLFAAYGAQEDFLTDEKISWLSACTFRHPTLLTALASYLSDRQWKFTLEDIFSVLKGDYAQQLKQHTQSLLKSTVPDESSRELLYRLNLVNRSFTAADVRRVSEVPPTIPLAFEKIDDSIGLWVQKDSADAYLLSPLLFRLGSENLAPATQRGVHLAVGFSIVERKRIGPSEALQAITHFSLAEAYNQAGIILLLALTTMRIEEVKVDVIGLSGFWYNKPLPEEMELDIRLHLRAAQIALAEQLGRDTSYLLLDLDSLLEKATDKNAQAVMAATMIAGPLLDIVDLRRANKYLLKALSVKSKAIEQGADLYILSEGVAPETLIWANGGEIKSADDLRDWLTTLEQFTPQQRENASLGVAAEGASLAVPDRLWIVEENKAEDAHDWDAVLNALHELAHRAQNLSMELLWAGAIRSSIIVLITYKKDIEGAIRLANKALASSSLGLAARFAIKEVVGFQLFFQSREADALPWLEEALAEPTGAFPLLRSTALLIISQIVGATDPTAALNYVQQSVEIARTSELIPETNFIKSLGEFAVAQWLAGNMSDAYLALEEAAEHLLVIKDESTSWKDLFLVLAHVAGYLGHMLRTGTRPQVSVNGELQDSPPPARGLFLNYLSQADQYNEARVPLFAGSMARFAENIGNVEHASKWALRAFDMALELGDRRSQVVLSHFALGHLIAADRLEEAIDVSLDVGASTTAIEIETTAGRNPFRPKFDLYEALGPKYSEAWIKAENRAAYVSLIPILFKLCTIKFTDPTQATSHSMRIANVCRQVATTASAPDLWNSAAKLFEEIFNRNFSFNELINRGNQFESPVQNPLRVLCYAGAALYGTPEEAITAHLAIFPALHQDLSQYISLYGQTFVPFIRTFWLRIFQESRFKFTNPSFIKTQLTEALKLPDDQLIQRFLGIVAVGLGTEPHQTAKDWID